MKLLHGLCLSLFLKLFVFCGHILKRNLTPQYSRIMQKFPGSSKILPIFESKMSDMTINLLERKRQTNSQTFHHGATEGRDGIVHGSGGGGGERGVWGAALSPGLLEGGGGCY